MRNRLLFALAAALLVLAGCSDDSSSDASDTGGDSTDETSDDSGDETSDDSGDQTSGDDSSDESEAGDDSTGDEASGDESVPSDALEIDPIGVTEQIDTMIEDAGADGDVTGEEIGDILEVAGTPEDQATCEGALLAELGVTDPTDPDQLTEAALAMTEDQRIALSVCLGGG